MSRERRYVLPVNGSPTADTQLQRTGHTGRFPGWTGRSGSRTSLPVAPLPIRRVLCGVALPHDIERALGGGAIRIRTHPVAEPALTSALGPLMLQAVVPPFGHDPSIPSIRGQDEQNPRTVAVKGWIVARAGIEPATFRFSGERSYQLSYLAAGTRNECHPMDGGLLRTSTGDPDGTRTRDLRRDRAAR